MNNCPKCGAKHMSNPRWQGDKDAVTINCLTNQLAAKEAENEKLRKIIELHAEGMIVIPPNGIGRGYHACGMANQEWTDYYPTAAEAALALLERGEQC